MDLTWWADPVQELAAAGKDVFVYFNNDGSVMRCATPRRSGGSWISDRFAPTGTVGAVALAADKENRAEAA